MIRTKLWLVPLLVVAAFCVGCKPKDEIRTYTVEKEAEKPAPPTADVKYRLLGAIIPDGKGYSWFVRFYGLTEQVSPHEADFQAFLNSIRIGERRSS